MSPQLDQPEPARPAPGEAGSLPAGDGAGDDEEALRRDFFAYLCPTSPSPLGLAVASAHGCRIIARDGTAYLDFLSGIGVANTGHGHPRVVEAVVEQVRRHLHVMVYGEFVQESQVRLARALARILPPPLSMTYLTNSGAEAIEGAIKLARKATGRPGLIAFHGAYHGDTTGALALSGSESHRRPFGPLLPEVQFLPFGDEMALAAIDGRVAAVVVEPIQAEGGVRVPPPGFLSALREACRRAGALLIVDEVQTGFGRTGHWFACQHWGVVPDVLVMAKAMGGGMPLGGFAGRPELMRCLATDPPLSHLTTFGGHPASAAAGAASIQVIEEEGLLANARAMGEYLQAALRELAGGPAAGLIRDVRGLGLLIGIECDRPETTRAVIRGCLARRLIVGDCLWAPCVVKLAPPLTVTRAECDEALGTLAEVLEEIRRSGAGGA